MRIHRVGTAHCQGGENPCWDERGNALYFIDNSGRKVHRFVPQTGHTQSWELPEVVTTMVLREQGGAVVTLLSGIYFLDFDSGAIAPVHRLPDPPPCVFNDGKVDRRGRFVIGASTRAAEPAPDGGLFRLDPGGGLVELDGDIHFSNGPCFSPDDGTLYFADSWRNTVYAYDYDITTGAVANRRPFITTTDLGGLPDGATVDLEGLYWVAIYGGGKIAAFNPDGGLERVIDMPVKLVSSVGFGGPGLDLLYVTTITRSHLDPDDPVQAGAGEVYVVEGLGATGIPEPRFGG